MDYWHICKSGYGEWRLRTWAVAVNTVLIVVFLWTAIMTIATLLWELL